MARIRSIKPESFSSEVLAEVPVAARWTFAGLWTYCDDKGRGKADPRLIKAAIYPLDDDMTVDVIERHLGALERIGVVCRYAVGARRYLHVVNFHEHQHPSKPQPSKFPECPGVVDGGPPNGSHTVPEPLPERSGNGQGTLPVGVVVVRGREEERDTPAAPALRDGQALTPPPVAETVNLRAQRLTKTYTDHNKLSNFVAIMGIVKKAIAAGHTDEEITSALGRLLEEGRSVTADTLRVEIEGLPPRTLRTPVARPSTTDTAVAQGAALIEHFARQEGTA